MRPPTWQNRSAWIATSAVCRSTSCPARGCLRPESRAGRLHARHAHRETGEKLSLMALSDSLKSLVRGVAENNPCASTEQFRPHLSVTHCYRTSMPPLSAAPPRTFWLCFVTLRSWQATPRIASERDFAQSGRGVRKSPSGSREGEAVAVALHPAGSAEGIHQGGPV
jgi:hypothetical protein